MKTFNISFLNLLAAVALTDGQLYFGGVKVTGVLDPTTGTIHVRVIRSI